MIGSLIKKIRTFVFTNVCLKKAKSYGENIRVNHWCKFSPKTTIGDNCHFNGMKITGKGNVVIGNNFHSGGGILILTSNHNYDFGEAIPYDSTTIDGDVKIENNVWIGQNVTILQGVTIGEGAIIQAGSVVVSNISKCAIAGGHPAKEFKKRNVEHYYKLKQEKKYF
ncbi:acyltransferase [Eubacterium multiforme]|uniref:Acetyltransferase-like isoleucine patch superfamily enzyme n=1 Tax=Eubacterium multiforme TaxID=83339 RepID=A0ABT9UTC0_9FIRM|nr:acyltransferase [Eubacterium multiforme]MDQ0149534.1 acetyltransferase-like isoleucine patch superfamily enzyme [Eubacterium multiforme]